MFAMMNRRGMLWKSIITLVIMVIIIVVVYSLMNSVSIFDQINPFS